MVIPNNIFNELKKHDLSEIGLDVLDFVEEFKKKVTKPNKDYKSWLEFSKEDLKSSLSLYKKKYFRNSIYLLQQSIEKLSKYYGLSCGLISEKNLNRYISHDSPKIFKIFINKHSIELTKKLGGENIDMKTFEKALNNKKEMSTLNEETIKIYLDLPKLIEINIVKLKLLDKEIINKMILDLNLYVLGVLTYAHEVNTRYPKDEINYNLETPIIIKYDNIVKILKKVIKRVEK